MASNEPVRVEQCDRWAAQELLLAERVGGGDGNTYCARQPTLEDAARAFARHRTLCQADGQREALFDTEPDLGYSTAEPSLRVIVERYYGAHFPADEAAAFAAQYFAALTEVHQEKNDG